MQVFLLFNSLAGGALYDSSERISSGSKFSDSDLDVSNTGDLARSNTVIVFKDTFY